ncbi:hypothetical protein A9Q90_06795 [Gammaproteobacteria bacterium 54_18_T64]|nr:hypothetical protein A9Q90_06795 [Gammaproteobacteria bacterium 54_18_T64]
MNAQALFICIFFVFPIIMIFFKKYYLVKRGFSVKTNLWARIYERVFINMMAIYLLYMLVSNYSVFEF